MPLEVAGSDLPCGWQSVDSEVRTLPRLRLVRCNSLEYSALAVCWQCPQPGAVPPANLNSFVLPGFPNFQSFLQLSPPASGSFLTLPGSGTRHQDQITQSRGLICASARKLQIDHSAVLKTTANPDLDSPHEVSAPWNHLCVLPAQSIILLLFQARQGFQPIN